MTTNGDCSCCAIPARRRSSRPERNRSETGGPSPPLAAAAAKPRAGHQIYTFGQAKYRWPGHLMERLRGRSMTDNAYLACQVGIICGLLFLVAVAAVSQHPQWFG